MAKHYIRTPKWETTILDIQGGTDHWGWPYIERYKNSGPKHKTSRNPQVDPWRSPRSNKVQAEGKRNCILARSKWPVREIGTKLPIMFEVFAIKMQVSTHNVSRSWDTSFSMDQDCNWHISFWRWLLSAVSILHKQIPNHLQADLNDSTACNWTFEGHILWIWMAGHHWVRQWSLLHSWSLYQDNARV